MLKRTYLILAILGAVIPYAFFGQYIIAEGFNLPGFVAAVFANPPASGFTADLLISSVVFWVWMFYERSRRIKAIHPAIIIVVNLTIGLSCALPLYLYFREPSPQLTIEPGVTASA